MAITFVGQYRFPETDDANDTGTSLTFDKDHADVGTMQADDFVMAVITTRSQTGTPAGFSVTTTGGQTWTEVHDAQDNQDNALYWCEFDGTWTADPVFDLPGSTAVPRLLWVVILRGVDTADPFDVTFTWATDADTAYNIADFNTNTDGAWAFGLAGSVDNNTWTVNNSFVAPSGSGNIYRRTSGGTDASLVVCRKEIATAGAVGAFTMTQATLGADTGFKVFGAIKPAAGGQTVTGVVLTVTPSLPAGTLNHSVLGVALSATPSLPAGIVSTGVTIEGVALTVTPTLPAGNLNHGLTGVALAATPSLPTGKLNHSVTGVTLTASPSLPAGTLRHSLTGVTLSATPTQPAGKLNHSLTGATLSATPTQPQGQVTVPGAQTVTGVVLTITPTLPAGSLRHTLTALTLTLSPTLPAGQVAAPQTVTGIVLVVAPSLPAGTVIAAGLGVPVYPAEALDTTSVSAGQSTTTEAQARDLTTVGAGEGEF
jgi:hypothetical protein